MPIPENVDQDRLTEIASIDIVDATNTVVRLCVRGMAAEAGGEMGEARDLFWQAWRESSNDYEACIAAHYLARHQGTTEETLWWNQESLRRADADVGRAVRSFYPSLYLNVGYALEQLGQIAAAYEHYSLAAARLDVLGENPYANMIRMAVARGQDRTLVGRDKKFPR
jgi:hypothetical protein